MKHREEMFSLLPRAWLLFLFAPAYFVCQLIDKFHYQGKDVTIPVLTVGYIVFYCFCLYRIHKILDLLSSGKYSISPRAAVGFYLIPFYNLYWIFKWQIEFSNYINSQGYVTMLYGEILGILSIISLLTGHLHGSLAIICYSAIIFYIERKLIKHIQVMHDANNPSPP